MAATRSPAAGPGEGRDGDRRRGRRRLYCRGLLWGLAVGAAAGGAVGALVGLRAGLDDGSPAAGLGLGLVGAGYGVILGAVLAVLPSLVGAAILTEVISARHPDPASEDEVRDDFRLIFGAIIAVLHGGVLLALSVGGELSSIVAWLPFLAAADGAAVPMLWRARRSLGRLWVEANR